MVHVAIHKNTIPTIGFVVQTIEKGSSNSLNLVYFEMKVDGPWIRINILNTELNEGQSQRWLKSNQIMIGHRIRCEVREMSNADDLRKLKVRAIGTWVRSPDRPLSFKNGQFHSIETFSFTDRTYYESDYGHFSGRSLLMDLPSQLRIKRSIELLKLVISIRFRVHNPLESYF